MKFKRFLLLPLVAVLVVASLLGCSKPPVETGEKTATIIVLSIEGENLLEKQFTTEKTMLYDALYEIEELEIEAKVSLAGAMLKGIAIGKVVEGDGYSYFEKTKEIKEGNGEYITIYHDIDNLELKDLSGFMDDLTFKEKAYFASGVGVCDLPIFSGSTYIFTLIIF